MRCVDCLLIFAIQVPPYCCHIYAFRPYFAACRHRCCAIVLRRIAILNRCRRCAKIIPAERLSYFDAATFVDAAPEAIVAISMPRYHFPFSTPLMRFAFPPSLLLACIKIEFTDTAIDASPVFTSQMPYILHAVRAATPIDVYHAESVISPKSAAISRAHALYFRYQYIEYASLLRLRQTPPLTPDAALMLRFTPDAVRRAPLLVF